MNVAEMYTIWCEYCIVWEGEGTTPLSFPAWLDACQEME